MHKNKQLYKNTPRSMRIKETFQDTERRLSHLIKLTTEYKIMNCYDYNKQKKCDQATFDEWKNKYWCPGNKGEPDFKCTSGCRVSNGLEYVCSNY